MAGRAAASITPALHRFVVFGSTEREAREMLAKRLARRGLALSTASLAAVLAQNVAAVPPPLRVWPNLRAERNKEPSCFGHWSRS